MKLKQINKLDEKLLAAQKGAKVRLLNHDTVWEKLSEVQDELDVYLYKKDQVGIRVLITVYTRVASSYNGIPLSTFVVLERGKTVWKLIDVYRERGIEADAKILNIDKFSDKVMNKVTKNLDKILTDA
ncbi:hypothetical protein M3904_003186 [Vibrio parahaemolyticus]|nr:hypothetical protein [Vibrio parahaemolyticus]HDM8241712.1 hypothetical protein [Vibrio campbellii]